MPVIQPILPPQDGLQRFWGLKNLWQGPVGTSIQRYVPNVDDLVHDYNTGWFRVVNVDQTTYLSTLVPWAVPDDSNGVQSEDTLLAAGPGSQSESYRIFHNSQTVPFSTKFDGRLHIYAKKASYVKLYLGRDATGNGTVISAMYNGAGVITTDRISLSTVANPCGETLAIKAPDDFYVTQQLDTGEVVTAVVYAADGQPLSSSALVVLRSEGFKSGTDPSRYITDISLVSQFVSNADPSVIQMPLSMPVTSALFFGVVTYSDGSSIQYPVGNANGAPNTSNPSAADKFKIAGLTTYISSELGERVPVQLIYTLAPSENGSVVQQSGSYRFMKKDYTIETVEAQNNYNVKLFSFPTWDSSIAKYTMRHFLTNLDREEYWDVTDHTRLHVTSPAFNGAPNGITQSLTWVCELAEVDAIFSDFQHVTSMDITLSKSQNQTGPKWSVKFSPGLPAYGTNVVALSVAASAGKRTYDISCGYHDLNDWLTNLFYNTGPIYNPSTEQASPQPTHVVLMVEDQEITVPVSTFETPIEITASSTVTYNAKSVYLRFEQHVGADVYVLGLAALPVDNS